MPSCEITLMSSKASLIRSTTFNFELNMDIILVINVFSNPSPGSTISTFRIKASPVVKVAHLVFE